MSKNAPEKNPKSNTRRDVIAAERALLAVKLRASKLSYEEIAKRCGYANKAACYNAVQRELNRVVVENVEELRREELATLDHLQQQVMPLIEDKDNRGRLFAVDRILAIQERRSRLMGLDIASGDVIANQVVIREVPPGLLPPGGQP